MEENQPQAVDTAPAAAPPKKTLKLNRISYKGQTGALYRIWLGQLFLSILTLGIYNFWGKTKIRRYLFASTELDGDRLEYLGTGKELFLGMLKILPFYFVLMFVYIMLEKNLGHGGGALVLVPAILYFMPVAQYSGFRYRLTRTSWRGIRGIMHGSALAYGGKYLLGSLVSFVTLGWKIPSVDLQRWEYQVSHMRFGSVPFRFKGNVDNLTKVNIVTLLLFIPTLGFSRTWYQAAFLREKLRGLSLGSIRFRSTATAGNFLGLMFGNIFILILTLGFGMPLVIQRNVRFFEQFIALGGDLQNFNAEQAEMMGKAGDAEGLLDVLDVDAGIIGA